MKKLILILFFGSVLTISAFSQPVLEWEDFFSDSTGNESFKDIVSDGMGNCYAVGNSTTRKGDIFLVKYNSSGSKLWVKKYDNIGETERVQNVLYDLSGYIYVVGTSVKSDLIGYTLVLKYTSSGALVWANTFSTGPGYIGLGGTSRINSVLYSGRIYILQNLNASYYGNDVKSVLYKINSDGTYIYTVMDLVGYYNLSHDMTMDPAGNIYVTGESEYASSIHFGIHNGFVRKYNNSLVMQWHKNIRDTVSPCLNIWKIGISPLGKIIISGEVKRETGYYNQKMIVSSLSPSDGVVDWYKRYNANDSNIHLRPNDMKIDKSGTIIVGGDHYPGMTGGIKGFFTVFKHTGGLMQYRTIDGMYTLHRIAVDSISNVYLIGNPYHPDRTIVKFNPSGILEWTATTSLNGDWNNILLVKPNLIYVCGDVTHPSERDFHIAKFRLTPGSSRPMGELTSTEPNSFRLEDNYPNPFNPATTIKFSLPVEGLTTLKVYDIEGKEVASLINENRDAGEYEVNFDASELSSGVYFYRLTCGSFTDVKKMMLVK